MFRTGIAIAVTLMTLPTNPVGHAADPVPTDAERLKESLAKWEKVRGDCGGNYAYEVRWSSAFGFGHRTTITVKENKVTERKFEEFARPEPPRPGEKPADPKPKWVETGTEIGSHAKEGAAARNVDELYAEAKKIVEGKLAEGHRLFLGFDKQGLLSHCFTRDTRIADDAPMHGVAPFQIQVKAAK